MVAVVLWCRDLWHVIGGRVRRGSAVLYCNDGAQYLCVQTSPVFLKQVFRFPSPADPCDPRLLPVVVWRGYQKYLMSASPPCTPCCQLTAGTLQFRGIAVEGFHNTLDRDAGGGGVGGKALWAEIKEISIWESIFAYSWSILITELSDWIRYMFYYERGGIKSEAK